MPEDNTHTNLKNGSSAEQRNRSTPTQQMSTFMSQAGIDPAKYGAMNESAENTKRMLDQRIEDYRREKASPR